MVSRQHITTTIVDADVGAMRTKGNNDVVVQCECTTQGYAAGAHDVYDRLGRAPMISLGNDEAPRLAMDLYLRLSWWCALLLCSTILFVWEAVAFFAMPLQLATLAFWPLVELRVVRKGQNVMDSSECPLQLSMREFSVGYKYWSVLFGIIFSVSTLYDSLICGEPDRPVGKN